MESWKPDVGGGTLGEEQVKNVVGGAVAEELAERLLMPGNAMGFDEREEVVRGVAGQG